MPWSVQSHEHLCSHPWQYCCLRDQFQCLLYSSFSVCGVIAWHICEIPDLWSHFWANTSFLFCILISIACSSWHCFSINYKPNFILYQLRLNLFMLLFTGNVPRGVFVNKVHRKPENCGANHANAWFLCIAKRVTVNGVNSNFTYVPWLY